VQLQHDNIVKVVDAGKETDGTLYIAMEYFKRGSLEDVCRGRPAQLRAASRYIRDVCWGLEYAHNQNFIHRDIKPANVLVSDGGEAKLSDFGLATKVPKGLGGSPYGYLSHLAPEVFTSGATSAVTDVFALGVTAYRLFNGDSYLDSSQDPGSLQKYIVAGKFPDRTRYRPYVPDSIKRIINRAMHVDSNKRYQSAHQFRVALEQIRMHCDWRQKVTRDEVIYTAVIDGARIKTAVRKLPNGRSDIITTKRPKNGLERRVTADCARNLGSQKRKRVLHAILARYVETGK